MQPSNFHRRSPIVEAAAKQFHYASPLRDYWAGHLATLAWDHYATLTFASAVSVNRARREFVDGFVRRCAFHSLRPIFWFYAMERDAIGDRIHVHALIAGTTLVNVARIEGSWPAGHSRIRIYNRTRGAAGYVVKTIATDHAEYDVSTRWPPIV